MIAAVVLTTTLFLPLVGIGPDMGTAAMTADNCDDLRRIGAAWSYQWHPWPVRCDGIQMIPMIWSMEWWSPTAAPSPYLLGFNEPNREDQADMSPQEGAVAWRKVDTAYPYRMLVSPAPTEVEWLRQWRMAYLLMYNREPRISAIGAHIYRTSLEDARATLSDWQRLAREWRKPLWVTEYAFPPCWTSYDSQQALQISSDFTRDLRQTKEVARYAWFGSRLDPWPEWMPDSWPQSCDTGLFDQYNQPTEFGEWFQLRGMM